MYKRYNNDNCERSRPIMGTWCNRDSWCDREEDDRGRRDCWCEREEDDRGQRDCDRNENDRGHKDCDRREDERGNRDRCDRREDERGRRNCCDHREDEYENNIYINTNIDIDQEATATGGDGGNGGEAEGGNGGNATATNIAEVTVENVIIIAGNSDHPMPPIHLGSNGRDMDIKIDKEGNAFVNGKKLDAQNLEDGSKVLIFRDSQVKKEEKKDNKQD